MGVMQRLQTLQTLAARTAGGSEEEARSEACLNCGTALVGPYCSTCGQRDIPPYPSVRELVVDAFWELSGWDGRFASTVRALVDRPGKLTREFLEGRRARYLSPLRLYLLASLLYFLVAAAAPDLHVKGTTLILPGVTLTVDTTTKATQKPASRPEHVAEAARDALQDPNSLTAAQKAAALKDGERAPALLRPFVRRAIGDPAGLKRGMVESMPRMLFALLPVFALIVSLFYRGRRYPEHLYFAIHFHAFLFLALTLGKLSQFTRMPNVVTFVGSVALIWIPIYSTLAFRRVYGGSIGRTIAKEIAIATIYAVVSMIALVCLVYWVSVSK